MNSQNDSNNLNTNTQNEPTSLENSNVIKACFENIRDSASMGHHSTKCDHLYDVYANFLENRGFTVKDADVKSHDIYNVSWSGEPDVPNLNT